eukprot:2818254-Prymnesium_polylepis.1
MPTPPASTGAAPPPPLDAVVPSSCVGRSERARGAEPPPAPDAAVATLCKGRSGGQRTGAPVRTAAAAGGICPCRLLPMSSTSLA